MLRDFWGKTFFAFFYIFCQFYGSCRLYSFSLFTSGCRIWVRGLFWFLHLLQFVLFAVLKCYGFTFLVREGAKNTLSGVLNSARPFAAHVYLPPFFSVTHQHSPILGRTYLYSPLFEVDRLHPQSIFK